MSSLLQLFTRQGAVFLFAALELFCLYLIITYNSDQGEVYDATKEMYSGYFAEQTSTARNYLRLQQLNDQLRAENAELLSRLPNAYYAEALDSATVDTINENFLRQRYDYFSGEIINKSPMSANITYVINRGHIHGVEHHSGVINGKGIVGIVTEVANRHSRVMSITHRAASISAGLRGTEYFGSLKWDARDSRYMQLYGIPDYSKAKLGDTVESTGFSNIFPTGVPIGTVATVDNDKSEGTYILGVALFNELFTVNDVYVIKDLMKEDLNKLDNPE